VNRKADFLQNESIRIDSYKESNRFESQIGILYCLYNITQVCILFYTGWAKKTALFFRLDNFVTVSPRKACSMSKFSKFYPEKGTKLVFQLILIFFAKFAEIITTAEIMLYMTRTRGFYSIYTNIQ